MNLEGQKTNCEDRNLSPTDDGFLHLIIQIPLFPSCTDSPHGRQAGVSIWCQLQIVQRWRAAGMQGCAISSPHSSQFTHQTLPSTLWSLGLLHKNPLAGRYDCRASERAGRAAASVMSKVWMTMNKRNPQHFKLGSTFSIIPKIRCNTHNQNLWPNTINFY